MKAWQITRLGAPADALRWTELDEPVAGTGQLVVRVRAAAANFPDVLMCRGEYQIRPELPFTPGVELCGEVIAADPRAGGEFEIGDRVIGVTSMPHGAFAELAVVNAREVFPAPAVLEDPQAAAFHIGYQTGWFGLHHRARLQRGETLLVHAAAGGVGSAAVQLGKAAGARVIAVVGGADKAEIARAQGADIVVDRTVEDFVGVVRAVTAGHGADVIYDPVGGETYTRSTKCIAFDGRIVVVGFAAGVVQAPALNHALVKNYSILGLHWGLYRQHRYRAVREAHDALVELADKGLVSPVIDSTIPLADLPGALTRLGAGDTVGRVIVRP
ncbi:NADPH:quinone oxidoreductase family protein [Nocardia jejuensis]|uniref:NADPH:quinone oxidoreductase family protein n=1 Tax=Nocardia jejuensis TaxID=328049 RepID=UPI0008320FF0|nr:NADPH:quinone oxidoreductase family protein [Nocardia jejuensis]